MGTRNLTCVVSDNEFVVAQYCQWDGYPAGQGTTILEFLRKADLDLFEKKLRTHTKFISDEEIQELWNKAGAVNGMATIEVSEKFEQEHPSLHRNTGAEILDLIYKTNDMVPLVNSVSFVEDGLFCEWIYVIDLDNEVLEVYQGVYQGDFPITRFSCYGLKPQVRLVKSYDLDDLPTNEDFVLAFGDDE